MKMSANLFRRITLGMGLVASILAAYEDEKMTKEELVAILNQLFIGLGAEVDFQGLQISPAVDGGLHIYLPPSIMGKLL
jgi:hypothetical protein